jgi:hypothetical protein
MEKVVGRTVDQSQRCREQCLAKCQRIKETETPLDVYKKQVGALCAISEGGRYDSYSCCEDETKTKITFVFFFREDGLEYCTLSVVSSL